ncbi:MAG: helix-turn-helix domain-containing protein [Candidatus Saccharimonadales bacterium]
MSDEATKDYLAKQIKKLRDDNGYTQTHAAERAGIYFNHYARIERGEIMPTYDTIKKLAKAFGVKPADLLPS